MCDEESQFYSMCVSKMALKECRNDEQVNHSVSIALPPNGSVYVSAMCDYRSCLRLASRALLETVRYAYVRLIVVAVHRICYI